MRQARFRAMGTDAHVIVIGGPGDALDAARARIEHLESRWSRFRPGSDIDRLNGAAGAPVAVSAETIALVRLAVASWRDTRGLFDPTVLPAVRAAGYDRSFELIDPSAPAEAAVPAAGCSGIVVDARAGTVALPPGAAFDPGGIGKGYAADLVAGALIESGARGVCVNLGGDLRCEGDGPGGEPWAIGVDATGEQIILRDGGVATSSTAARRWQRDGQAMHHLIDPRVGAPARTAVVAATVVASSAWRAEICAKAWLIGGADAWTPLLPDACATGLAVCDDGRIVHAPGIRALLTAAA